MREGNARKLLDARPRALAPREREHVSRVRSESADAGGNPLVHGLWEGLSMLVLFFFGLALLVHLLG